MNCIWKYRTIGTDLKGFQSEPVSSPLRKELQATVGSDLKRSVPGVSWTHQVGGSSSLLFLQQLESLDCFPNLSKRPSLLLVFSMVTEI